MEQEGSGPVIRCPVCKAENTRPGACRRCRADLPMLFALEERRSALLANVRWGLAAGRWAAAWAAAREADHLRSDTESQRLLAVAALLAGDHAGAWESYRRASSP